MNTPVRVVCDIGVHFFFDFLGCGIGVRHADKFLASLGKMLPPYVCERDGLVTRLIFIFGRI